MDNWWCDNLSRVKLLGGAFAQRAICNGEQMKIMKSAVLVLAATTLVACERMGDNNDVTDGGVDGGLLRDGIANVWVDPDGCQHWYIDDGLEGFMTPRLNRDGTPKCQDTRGQVMLKDGSMVDAEQEPDMPAA